MATGIHGRMVEQGARLGISRIELHAARDEKHPDGYLVWPILGYDGPLPGAIERREDFPQRLRGAGSLRRLLEDDEGRDWWKEKGATIPLAFDLAPGSPDRTEWIDYFRSRRGGVRRTMTLDEATRIIGGDIDRLGFTARDLVQGWEFLERRARERRDERERRGREAPVPAGRPEPSASA